MRDAGTQCIGTYIHNAGTRAQGVAMRNAETQCTGKRSEECRSPTPYFTSIFEPIRLNLAKPQLTAIARWRETSY